MLRDAVAKAVCPRRFGKLQSTKCQNKKTNAKVMKKIFIVLQPKDNEHARTLKNTNIDTKRRHKSRAHKTPPKPHTTTTTTSITSLPTRPRRLLLLTKVIMVLAMPVDPTRGGRSSTYSTITNVDRESRGSKSYNSIRGFQRIPNKGKEGKGKVGGKIIRWVLTYTTFTSVVRESRGNKSILRGFQCIRNNNEERRGVSRQSRPQRPPPPLRDVYDLPHTRMPKPPPQPHHHQPRTPPPSPLLTFSLCMGMETTSPMRAPKPPPA